MTVRLAMTAGAAALVLAGCGEPDVILPGERYALRSDAVAVNRVAPLALPAAQANADWTHRGATPAHVLSHPALGASLREVFAAPIGQGDSRRGRITADPVVAGGLVYTLDAAGRVTATTTSGGTVWSADLSPALDGDGEATGGGLAVSGGRVYAATGYGELTQLDAASGAVIWRQDLEAPAMAAPTVAGGLVYVVSRNGTAWALETGNGRIRWTTTGNPSEANLTLSAAPGVSGDLVVFPFSSGEVAASFAQGGTPRWRAVVTGGRPGEAASVVTDIPGDPVISGGRVYVGNFGGQIVALDAATGDTIWSAGEGAASPVWPAGDSLFAVNDLGQLLRLDAATGRPVWRVALPRGDSGARRGPVTAHFGPVLAGGRLIVAGSDGLIRQFDPASGASLGSLAIAGGAATNPVVAGQTLYVVSKTGQLHAFR